MCGQIDMELLRALEEIDDREPCEHDVNCSGFGWMHDAQITPAERESLGLPPTGEISEAKALRCMRSHRKHLRELEEMQERMHVARMGGKV